MTGTIRPASELTAHPVGTPVKKEVVRKPSEDAVVLDAQSRKTQASPSQEPSSEAAHNLALSIAQQVETNPQQALEAHHLQADALHLLT